MRLAIRKGVYIRHTVDGNSIVWYPKLNSCTVFRDSRPFLDEIGYDWREVNEIAQSVANKFKSLVEDVHDDLKMVLVEMKSQGFIICEDEQEQNAWTVNVSTLSDARPSVSDNEMLLAEFCEDYGILDLHIDLTDACTESCIHCYVPKGQNFLSVEMCEKALTEFRAANGLTVHLTGGEAMMHPGFERICRKCVELNLNMIIYSNMTICDDKRIAFLKEIQPQFINVSLYSMKSDVHDAITQLPGSWDLTVNAILKCCEAGVICRIATPILKENKESLSALWEFANEHNLKFVPSADIVAKSNHQCENLFHACSKEEIRCVLKRNREFFHKTYDGVMPSCDDKVCDIGTARICLNAKGDYYPCDSMHEYVLGNVRENTFTEILKGKKLAYLRNLKNRDFGECVNCEKRPWCRVCPAANFNATGNVLVHHQSACGLAEVIRQVYG